MEKSLPISVNYVEGGRLSASRRYVLQFPLAFVCGGYKTSQLSLIRVVTGYTFLLESCPSKIQFSTDEG